MTTEPTPVPDADDDMRGALQDPAEWDAGYMLPYGRAASADRIQQAMDNVGVAVRDTPFPGSRLYEAANGTAGPSIVVLHGSGGGADGAIDLTAIQWAAAGFRALSYAYFGVPGTPHALAGVSAYTALEAAKWLGRDRPVGVVGRSRGAEFALILASYAEAGVFGAVVAHAPQDHHVAAFAVRPDGRMVFGRDTSGAAMPAWIVGGIAVPEGTPIPVEQIRIPTSLSVGTADDVWSPDGTFDTARRMAAAGNLPVVHTVEGGGHSLELPELAWVQQQNEQFLRRHLPTT